jgi:hypothetical protein
VQYYKLGNGSRRDIGLDAWRYVWFREISSREDRQSGSFEVMTEF